jgi:hypothetical protein
MPRSARVDDMRHSAAKGVEGAVCVCLSMLDTGVCSVPVTDRLAKQDDDQRDGRRPGETARARP